MMLEERNDQLDADVRQRAKAVIVPGSEDAYASMLAQYEKRQGVNKPKLPRMEQKPMLTEMTHGHKAMLAALGNGPVNRQTLAKMLGVSAASISDYAKRLMYLRLVRKQNRGEAGTLYFLVEKETK